MFLQELLGCEDLKGKKLGLAHNVGPVFGDQAICANPFRVSRNESVAAFEFLM